MEKRYLWLVPLLCAASVLVGYGIGRAMITNDDEYIGVQEESVPVSDTANRITPSTKMVYEYYYPEDGITEVYEDVPPYFLIDYTLEDIKRCYSNWTIKSFSDREVVMKKTVLGPSNQRYIIGERDGFVTVFYDVEERFIKEITKTPIDSLPENERAAIIEGIRIVGDEKLLRALEDYTS